MSSEMIRVIRGFKFGSTELSKEHPIDAGAMPVIDEEIPNEASDLELTFALDISECSAVVIAADQVLTIKTNDSVAPDDTITTVAGKQIDRVASDGEARRIFTVDVTGNLFVSNASGAAARLRIFGPYDPTPA